MWLEVTEWRSACHEAESHLVRSLRDELFGMPLNAIECCMRSLSDGVLVMTLEVIELLSACNDIAYNDA